MGRRKAGARREPAADAGPATPPTDEKAPKRNKSPQEAQARRARWSPASPTGRWWSASGRGSPAAPCSSSSLRRCRPIQLLEVPKRPPTVEIVGIDGRPLTARGEMTGTDISIKELPPYLPRAFVAIEDRRFYSHFGVDPVGLARAAARQCRCAVAYRRAARPSASSSPRTCS